MQKTFFTLSLSFTGSYTEDEPNFPANNLILQTKVSGVDKVVNFKGFLRPNKKNQVLFKDRNRIQGLFKTTSKIQDLFNIVRTMSGCARALSQKFDLVEFLNLI